MKIVELQLNKRLLIVEFPENGFSEEKNIKALFDSQKYINAQLGNVDEFKIICKGSDLTEDIAKGLFEYDCVFEAYQYYQNTVPILGDTALNLFKVAIRNNGYYWGEPLKSWFISKRYVGVERIEESFDYEKWQEAESRTFNPNKSIICEIV